MQYRVGKTHCQGHQDPSKRVPIFLGTHEANYKMVPIGQVPIPPSHTVSCVIADGSGEEIGGIVGLTPFLSPELVGGKYGC